MSVYTAIRASKIVFWYPRHKISAFENFWKFSIFFEFFRFFLNFSDFLVFPPLHLKIFEIFWNFVIFSKMSDFQKPLKYEEKVKNTCGKVRLEAQGR